jgi:uncharacterized Fe-S cluster-containing radical SAM superfamily protein
MLAGRNLMAAIKTDDLSVKLRERSIRTEARQLLITRFDGSAQEGDLSEPPNCGGYGRIHHFRMSTPDPWPDNPLPILPAAYRLNVPVGRVTNAQVFQNAACNWRCWYCFVPYSLLAANEHLAGWLRASQLIDLYLAESERPLVIDCSGGQPDLVPEWVPWMMTELRNRGIADSVYLWSDDNLSNDYFWRYLNVGQLRTIAEYRNYGRVCCFKGYSPASFAFNTKADPALFSRQFELFARLKDFPIDVYAYATFTAPDDRDLSSEMTRFMDCLQRIHARLPLRLVPLRIEDYGVVTPRLKEIHHRAMAVQEQAIIAWNDELRRRFTVAELSAPMPTISLEG